MVKKHSIFLAFICSSLIVSLSPQVSGRIPGDGDAIGRHRPFRPLITGKPSEVDLINHWTNYQTKIEGPFYGAAAEINIYDLTELTGHQASHALIMLMNNKNGLANTIAAGVHVYPELYKDTKAHFFTYWTADGGASTGCINLLCPGFVKVNSSRLTPGEVISPPSVYGGRQRYFTLTIKKEDSTGDWSLYREDLGGRMLVGYWPKTLFSNLADDAARISWGGQVSFAKNEKSPPMGSGHFSEEGGGKAAFFSNIKLYDGRGGQDLNKHLGVYNDRGDCYHISDLKISDDDGFFFYYGGPSCN